MLCRVNARAAGERNWPTTGWPIASPGACRGAPARTTVQRESLFVERESLLAEQKGSPVEQKGSRVERETRPRDKKRGVAGWPRPCRGPANAGRLRGRQLDRRL